MALISLSASHGSGDAIAAGEGVGMASSQGVYAAPKLQHLPWSLLRQLQEGATRGSLHPEGAALTYWLQPAPTFPPFPPAAA